MQFPIISLIPLVIELYILEIVENIDQLLNQVHR